MSADGYVLPGLPETVLHNRAGLTDPSALAVLEREATVLAMIDMADNGVPRTFDRSHLCALHGRLFGAVYEWAGRMRDERYRLSDGTQIDRVDRLEKGGSLFAAASEIGPRLDRLAGAVDAAAGLEEAGRFAQFGAGVLAELNFIHPFREGNGRTQRCFVDELARAAGHELDWAVVDAERNLAASAASVAGDQAQLFAMVQDAVMPERRALLREAMGALAAGADRWVIEAGLARRSLRSDERAEGTLVDVTEQAALVMTSDNELVVGPRDALEDVPLRGVPATLVGALYDEDEPGMTF